MEGCISRGRLCIPKRKDPQDNGGEVKKTMVQNVYACVTFS